MTNDLEPVSHLPGRQFFGAAPPRLRLRASFAEKMAALSADCNQDRAKVEAVLSPDREFARLYE